jgi:flagellar FliL protein
MHKSLIHCLLLALLMLLAPLAQAGEDEAAPKKKEPAYVSLGKPMVLNLTGGKRRRLTFLQIAADVLVKDDEARAVVEQHIPAIRHQLILMLSEQKADDLKSPATREKIRQQITNQVRDMIEEMTDNNDIDEILFTTFLVQ